MASSSVALPATKTSKAPGKPAPSTNAPTEAPSDTPSDTPSDAPSDTPSDTPTETATETTPTETPTEEPSDTPTPTPAPTSSSSPPTTESSTTSSTTSTSTSSSSSSSHAPTTTTAPETTSTPESTVVTKVSTFTPTDGGSGAVTTVVTSTGQPTQTGTSANDATSTTGGSAALETSPSTVENDSGLSTNGTIAVAVVVPVVSVALIIVAAIYLWRKRKAKKLAEEERRKEVEDYGFNPNNDPSLPPFGGTTAVGTQDDSSGYRGWGATSSGRKASTNLSSGIGMAMSEAGSGLGYHHAASPSDGTIQYSDGRPTSGEAVEPVGVLGAAPAAANNRTSEIHRGPSNASSAYSGANRSEASDDSHMSASHPTAPYYEDNAYYSEMQPQYGPFADGPYGGSQPVIRDVQARRNTRIESPAVLPRQGNAGIAQNF